MRLLLFFFLFSIAAQGQDFVPGVYKSIFNEGGWFGTHLELHSDSSFYYLNIGDMARNEGRGNYTFSGDTIILYFNPLPESEYVVLSEADTILTPAALSYFPRGFINKKGRLYRVEKDGELIKKAYNGEHRRRYYIFGRGYPIRRPFYLELEDSLK